MASDIQTSTFAGITAGGRTVRTSVHSLEEWPAFAPAWEELLLEDANYSVFLSLPWMETWIETFRDAVDPCLLVFRAGGLFVGASLIVKSSLSLSRPLRRISINASGENAADTTYVEFNDVLARRDWETRVGEALARYALQQPWEELVLDGFCPGPAYHELKRLLTGTQVEEVWRPSYYVDLAALRHADLTYLNALGPQHRKHLQQNLRYHAEQGELSLQVASDVAGALHMFEELAALNRRRRECLGEYSVFTSERFIAFHRSFIRQAFPSGNVQLLRVTAGENIVGLVYNLVYRGKVYFYQCGYNYTDDKRLSPGSVTLALAIQHCLDHGFREFDFLAGDAPYKASMSTGSRSLVWAKFRRPGARVWAYETARDIKTKIKNYAEGSKA
jgi:CelD/BcsL family acetyltransferase involved in cellulose biosynthesis